MGTMRFQVEAIARAKALGWEQVWCVPDTEREPRVEPTELIWKGPE